MKEKQNNISCDCEKYENRDKKRQQITELTENVPSCNYCVATIVARPLQTTVKGGRQPSAYEEIKINDFDSVDSRIRKGFGTETFVLS